MDRNYLLGIDIGTSACKIAVFTREGSVFCSCTEEYPVYYPQDGFVEQEPDDWWKAVCRGIRRLFSENPIQAFEIAGIGIDGQSWAAVAIDGEGSVLTRNPIWLDSRSKKICQQVEERIGAKRLFEFSGNPLKPQYTTGKILWYKEHLPDVYRKINKILQSNSFIIYRLTGVITQDVSQGYGIHAFDMHKGCWDNEMCREIGIPRSFLPEIAACHEIVGQVLPEAAAQTGLLAGTPVVAGGLDAACGTLGAGVIDTGETQEQGGQAGGMSICISEYCSDPRLILGYHVIPGKWLLQGGTTGGGGALKWFERQFGYEERLEAEKEGCSSFELLSRLGATVDAGSDGVIFLPYMAGERSPIWDENAKAIFYGLDYSKTKAHMVRAVMEGVAYSLRHNLDVAESAGAKAGKLRAMGGSANSLLWTQIKADVTGRDIEVPSSDTATTLGAALLAGVGIGMYRDFPEATASTVKIKRMHFPDSFTQERYRRGYETYLELVKLLKNLMEKNRFGSA